MTSRSSPSDPLMAPRDPAEALSLLTVLPTPELTGPWRGPAAAWAWPLAGLAVALLAWLLGAILAALALPPGVVAAAVLAVLALLTGGLHEDGLGDSADGLFGGRSRERRLEIMKDSRVGSFGLLAVLLVTLARWSALVALLEQGHMGGGLIAAAMLARACLPGLMVGLPAARPGGLGASAGVPQLATVLLGLGLALVGALLAAGWAALVAAVMAGLTALPVAALARARIGGHTGDILGASLLLAETVALATLAAG